MAASAASAAGLHPPHSRAQGLLPHQHAGTPLTSLRYRAELKPLLHQVVELIQLIEPKAISLEEVRGPSEADVNTHAAAPRVAGPASWHRRTMLFTRLAWSNSVPLEEMSAAGACYW